LSDSKPTHHDAELILKLYDLRREPVMREARAYFVSVPASEEAFLAVITNPMSKENSYVRQVLGYWEMVAALVVHQTLNEALVFDTCQEMYFAYAKIQPYVTVLREKLGTPEFLSNVQKVVEGSEQGRQRISRLQARFAARADAPAKAAG
jgi:hypothetical protein